MSTKTGEAHYDQLGIKKRLNNARNRGSHSALDRRLAGMSASSSVTCDARSARQQLHCVHRRGAARSHPDRSGTPTATHLRDTRHSGWAMVRWHANPSYMSSKGRAHPPPSHRTMPLCIQRPAKSEAASRRFHHAKRRQATPRSCRLSCLPVPHRYSAKVGPTLLRRPCLGLVGCVASLHLRPTHSK